MFMVHSNHCPLYLSESIASFSSNRDPARSVSGPKCIMPLTRTKFRDRDFSVAIQKVWNSLLESVRIADTLDIFKQNLKMCF